ncbi:MAG TPA: methyltransferase domain-containing protein [Ktedonobacterales bacterium]|nr:methyltransferase domain-containing protein [Ktedonobacterales bacterium]
MSTAKTEAGTQTAAIVDEDKVHAFLGKAVTDGGAAMSAALVMLGDRLGLYKAMRGAGPLTPAGLAQRTNTNERYVREWLLNQAAGGYVDYDAATGRYTLPEEHAIPLTDANSAAYIGGMFSIVAAFVRAEPRIEQAFQTGDGMLWGEHDPILFPATERFFRPGYAANLVSSWIPALGGVAAKLETGGKAADVGCGHGASTIILAQAYPNSRFWGFDVHAPSIAEARKAAEAAGVADRVTFEVAAAQDFPGGDYDLVAYFDCLHDMGDPVGAIQHTAQALAPDGAVLIVEPMAGLHVEDNFNIVGRFYSGASVLCCTPNALASGGKALCTVASDDALREVVANGGLSRFRRAAETPFNRIFEAKR